MHSFALVLIPHGVVDIRKRLDEILGPFYYAMEFAEYKQFYSDAEALRDYSRYDAGNDVELLVRLLNEEGHLEFGLENGRFYELTTYNPNAKWDW